MNYMPPAFVQQVGDPRFVRCVVRDAIGQFWMGDERWSSEPADAALFCRETDALEAMTEHRLSAEA